MSFTIGATSLAVDTNGNPAISTAPTSSNINNGFLSQTTATTGTLLTVNAGKTWIGTIGVSIVTIATGAAAGGLVSGAINTAGAGVTPAAGTIMSVVAGAGSNVAGGTVGTQGMNGAVMSNVVVVAPAGNSVTLTFTTTVNGSQTQGTAWAVGVNQ